VKAFSEVSSEKLRGGFYTPASLVEVCLNRVAELTQSRTTISVLEPSIGDGAFLRALKNHPLSVKVRDVFGVEIVPAEAQKAREAGEEAIFSVQVINTSVLEWAIETNDYYDAVVGNPPFVRYQFVSKSDLKNIELLGECMGILFRGVSNLWIPVLLGSLNRLCVDGAMAIVVPAEIFTGLSAGDARSWLLENFTELRIDMFEPGSFPDVLQEVVIISGKKTHPQTQVSCVEFIEHLSSNNIRVWHHPIPVKMGGWTRYLLTPKHISALEEAYHLPSVVALGKVARLEVSIVTGANDFFTVTSDEVKKYGLEAWAEPLLPRIRHAEGLIYTKVDHHMMAQSGTKAWLLDFNEQRPDPLKFSSSSSYIKMGEDLELDMRYKTSIRYPWYRVPSVWSDSLFLSKRSHWYPRLVLNQAGALTTDTIYRGRMLPPFEGRENDLAASFHNSLTLLTAEIEGRSFGGGVLELVPSEVARLRVSFSSCLGKQLEHLDDVARACASDQDGQSKLIEATDELLALHVEGFSKGLLADLHDARLILANRRFSRN
jgi:adenine-specific DNA-methyltransferase